MKEFDFSRMVEEETDRVESSFRIDESDPLDEFFVRPKKSGRPKGATESPKMKAEKMLRKAVKFLKEAQQRLERYQNGKDS